MNNLNLFHKIQRGIFLYSSFFLVVFYLGCESSSNISITHQKNFKLSAEEKLLPIHKTCKDRYKQISNHIDSNFIISKYIKSKTYDIYIGVSSVENFKLSTDSFHESENLRVLKHFDNEQSLIVTDNKHFYYLKILADKNPILFVIESTDSSLLFKLQNEKFLDEKIY